MTDGLLIEASMEREWARENVAAAHRLMLATLEVLLVRRAELEAKMARIQCALLLDDSDVLRAGDVPEFPASSPQESPTT